VHVTASGADLGGWHPRRVECRPDRWRVRHEANAAGATLVEKLSAQSQVRVSIDGAMERSR